MKAIEPGQDRKIAALRFPFHVHIFCLEEHMKEEFLNKAIEYAKKAYEINEVPVGAVIVKDNEIV